MSQDGTFAGLTLIAPPATEPVTLAEAESFLNIISDGGQVDADVTLLITTARQHVEQSHLKRALLTQTWKLSLTNWPGRDYLNWPQSFSSRIDQYYRNNYIKLPLPRLQSVTSVNYMDSSGNQKSMSNANFTTTVANGYNVITTMEPGRIVLPFSQVWPTDILMPGAPIDITYVCGFTSMGDLQNWEGYGPTIHAIKLLIVDCWENRLPPADSKLNETLAGWLAPYRIYD